jgi:serine/threonine protein kinase
MFRGDKESVQLEKIFKLTGYPHGEVLELYNSIEGFTSFNTEELKSLTNQFTAKYLLVNDKSTTTSGNGGHSSSNSNTPLHHHHLYNSSSNYHPIQSKEVGYKVFDVDGLDLLQRLLDISPITRITAYDAMNHSYFQKHNPDSYNPIKSVIFPHNNVSYSSALCCNWKPHNTICFEASVVIDIMITIVIIVMIIIIIMIIIIVVVFIIINLPPLPTTTVSHPSALPP